MIEFEKAGFRDNTYLIKLGGIEHNHINKITVMSGKDDYLVNSAFEINQDIDSILTIKKSKTEERKTIPKLREPSAIFSVVAEDGSPTGERKHYDLSVFFHKGSVFISVDPFFGEEDL